jgi:hypothetical protein
MKTADIIALKNELVEEGRPRHRKYDTIMKAIGGNYDSRRMDGFWQGWQEITGRAIPADREMYEFKLNLLPSLISAKRSFIGVIPSLECPPSAPAEDPADTTLKQKAEKLERVYQGVWNYSHIGKRMNQIGYWNPTLGTSVGVVWPDVENKRPTLQIRSPYGFYPVLADKDGENLKSAIFHTTYKPRQVAAMYPTLRSKLRDREDEVSVTQYFDSSSIVTIIDDQYRLKDIKNKWGFVAMVIIPNEAFGEGPWGDSDIEWAIPMQEEHNYRESLKSAILDQTIMQPVAVEGSELAPEKIAMGPRDVIPVQLGGKVYRVGPIQVPYQYLQSQNDLLKLIDRVAQVPDVMRSQSDASVITGRGVSTLMGPTQMAFNVKGNEIYPAISMLTKMSMRMWHAMWPNEKHTVYCLHKGKSMTVEVFETAEFDGWYENIVYVDSASYFDAQSRFMMVLQSVQNRLMSRQTAMQYVPGVTDAPHEMKLIEAELAADMEMSQANVARDEANVQPEMGAQGATNANLEKGYMGKTPPPENIGGFETPELTGEAEEQAYEEGGLLEDMIEFFAQIPLKGKVWLAGNIVMDPTWTPSGTEKVEVFLTDPNDKAAINTTMRTKFPEVWGHIRYHSGEPSDEEPSVLVHDPTQEMPEEDFLPTLQGGSGGGQEAVPQEEAGPGLGGAAGL